MGRSSLFGHRNQTVTYGSIGSISSLGALSTSADAGGHVRVVASGDSDRRNWVARFGDPLPKRFILERASGARLETVGTGCEWPDGCVVLHSTTDVCSVTHFLSIDDLESRLRGHKSTAKIVWID